MAGRPPSSYAYPKLWDHVEELDLVRSGRAIKLLRYKDNEFKPPCGTQFSNRLIETKISPDVLRLLDYNTAHDLHALISWHRKQRGITADSPNKDLYRFSFGVNGLSSSIDRRASEHVDPAEEIAARCGLSSSVIYDAARGRLFPKEICVDIALAAGFSPDSAVVSRVVGRQGTPSTDDAVLQTVIAKLTA